MEKKQAMVERLTALDAERARLAEARRHDAMASASPLESPGAFQSAFDEQRKTVEQSLQRTREESFELDSQKKSALDSIASDIAALDKMVSDASYFLPPYDVQASKSTVQKLNQSLASMVSELLPRKRFSFRTKNSPRQDSESLKEDTVSANGYIKNCTVTLEAKDAESPNESTNEHLNAANVHTIKERKNCTVVLDAEPIFEVMLSDLNHCTVFVRGRFRAMFCHKLKDCHVYVGAVTGSILLEEVDGCIFMAASHQIRIHSTKNTDFYLRVRSRPIVEYVSGVRVAPYVFQYEGIDEHLREAGLDAETGLWEKVDDFRWLRAAASPNWSIIPLCQRVPLVDGSNVSSREFCSS